MKATRNETNYALIYSSEDILVFLTGQEEIETMAANVKLIAKDPTTTGPKIICLPIFAAQVRMLLSFQCKKMPKINDYLQVFFYSLATNG